MENFYKLWATEQFVRGGGTRRQDHGEWANTRHGKQRWHDECRFYHSHGDIEGFANRKVVRRGGVLEID